MKAQPNIGKTWAICDHFEGSTDQPVTLSTLIEATGYTRKQFRKWAHQGRLVEHRVTTLSGQVRIGYTRPKTEN